MVNKKNRKGGSEVTAPLKEAEELAKKNQQLQEQLASMAKQQQELAKQLQELTKATAGEAPPATAATTLESSVVTKAEKAEKSGQPERTAQPKAEPGVGDSLDQEWETVSHSKPKNNEIILF